MNSKEYIIQKIDQLANEFPGVKFSYQFDDFSDTHFIEVLPKVFFEKYEIDFISRQNQIILDFINTFIEEGLAFITENDLFKVDKPEYVICGNKYPVDKPNLSWNHEELSELLVHFKPEIQTSFILDQEIKEVKQNPINCNFYLQEIAERPNFEFLTNNLPIESKNTTLSANEAFDDNTDFFLAA